MTFGLPALILSVLVGGSDSAAAETADRVSAMSAWSAADEGRMAHIDHSTWQALLTRYLDGGHRSGIARFDYRQVTPAHRALLADYIATLTRLDPRSFARNEQKAYWINLYNAQTVLLVIDNPDIDSIRDIRPTWFSSGPWKSKDLTIGEESLSLDDIEHGILRPLFDDRRVHYALNCASLGCPNLSTQVFTGSNVDTLLARAEHTFVNHPRAAHFDGDVLVLSSLFEWYREDFAANERDLIEYLAQRHDTLAPRLRAHTGKVRYEYDWALNQP